jgi:hypothetical protein
MTHLLLAHLSKDNNDPQLVQQLFNNYAGGVEIFVASRYEQSPLCTIQQTDQPKSKENTPLQLKKTTQLELF